MVNRYFNIHVYHIREIQARDIQGESRAPQSPVFFSFFFAGSSASPFPPLLTGFGFGLGFGAAFSGSESTSIGSSVLPPFDFDAGFAGLAFFGFSLAASSSSSLLAFSFFFFVAGALSPCLADDAFDFDFFFGPFVIISRSPDASDAVAPPSESDALDSVGEPSSEEDTWKSSSVCVCQWMGDILLVRGGAGRV